MDTKHILDLCIDHLANGKTVQECLDMYPEKKEELLPLLEIAYLASKTVASIPIAQTAKVRSLKKTQSNFQKYQVKKKWNSWLNFMPEIPKPIAIIIITAFFTTTAVLGTNVASASSIPGDSLYWVKTAREDISLITLKSDLGKAKTHIKLAKVRGNEMSELVSIGKLEKAEQTRIRMNNHLNKSAVLIHVITPTNLVDMPTKSFIYKDTKNIQDLKNQLNKDNLFMKTKLEKLSQIKPLEEKSEIIKLRRKSELSYIAFIFYLDRNSSANHQLFWKKFNLHSVRNSIKE